MTRFRWATRAVCAAALVAAGVLPAVTAPPAGASHVLLASLQVTPEISSVQVGTAVTLTAHLRSVLTASDLPAPSSAQINFHFEGGPLAGTPDQSCSIAALASTCALPPLTAGASGTTLVRSWINGSTADATEGRLANTSAESSAASDCLPAASGESDTVACRTGDALIPGATAEPDDTDVVRITWRDRGVDVAPDNQARALGETATLTATAYNVNATPAANVAVKFEFFDGSVSDPGGGNTPATPDRTCTTSAAGTCAITVTQVADGIDLLCAWTSSAAPAMAGKVTDTGTCGGEVLFDVTVNDGVPAPIDDAIDVVRILWGNANPVITPPGTTPPPAVAGSGYWLVASDGGIFAFGDALFQGSTGAIKLNQPIVGMAATPTRKGYFLVASDGGIFAFGDAVFRGSTGAIKLNQPIVGMAATPNGGGYFLVAKDGGIFAFGNAVFRGSTGAIKLAQPIVGMDVTPSGNGYFLVAADGGVFAFGDAVFRGSTGAIKLAKPIVGITATPTGNGYHLVASDGGIFAFGDAVFRGSTGAIKLNQPIVGMSRSVTGGGYRLVASDGGIFAFGDALFKGSTGAIKLNKPMVGMAGF
ncbi:MAG: hypothetical protein ACR2MO_16445 [Acidimicrobiales bacterium]